ncbi:MAG TPA: hypothetical protein VM781_00965, partial [Candidatus Bathyarchaeia archaeon]|nr:hypothetical protein [Candidatus Bathyarchaeia archaeon]
HFLQNRLPDIPASARYQNHVRSPDEFLLRLTRPLSLPCRPGSAGILPAPLFTGDHGITRLSPLEVRTIL